MAHSESAMAAIDTRQTVNGPRYDVRFRDPAGHQRKKALRTKKEAERFAASVEADKWKGHWVDPAGGKTTLAAFASTWVHTRARSRCDPELRSCTRASSGSTFCRCSVA